MDSIFGFIANIVYGALAIVALWGTYCVIAVWKRVAQKRFKTEEQQMMFLEAIEEPLSQGDFETAEQICEGDRRALCQLAHLATVNRQAGYTKVKQLVLDRFERDVLGDLEHRLTWVNTVIKAAPMIGLFGTVLGMMGAFATLASASTVDPTELAADINVALYTTACGLAIAIPLVMATATINIRIRKMEDLIGSGLTHFFEVYRNALSKHKH